MVIEIKYKFLLFGIFHKILQLKSAHTIYIFKLLNCQPTSNDQISKENAICFVWSKTINELAVLSMSKTNGYHVSSDEDFILKN